MRQKSIKRNVIRCGVFTKILVRESKYQISTKVNEITSGLIINK